MILAMLLRPRGIAEAYWACAGALLLMGTGQIDLSAAIGAIESGTQVYLFLAGMMLLSEVARQEGVFDWVADAAVRRAKGSSVRLFLLVYFAGTIITTLLSNDATVVVLTPAVLAAVRRAQVEPRPHLLACAFVANAASFVLPVSNPANLVVFGNALPPLEIWLIRFGPAALVAVGATLLILLRLERRELREPFAAPSGPKRLSSCGRVAFAALIASAAALVIVSLTGRNLGLATLAAGGATALIVRGRRPAALFDLAKQISWSVLPLVAGLFVLVAALEGSGVSALLGAALRHLGKWPAAAGSLAAGFASGLTANAMNNLPVGLLVAGAVHAFHPPTHLTSALLVGVDLGPNLSITGSLATILWLVALRRENVRVSAGQFLRLGAIVMPLALAASLLVLGLNF
ncbi:MAG TPA: SLC13 family permease [Opitutaceae bacterium]|jgi:arsenical pump membrane protein